MFEMESDIQCKYWILFIRSISLMIISLTLLIAGLSVLLFGLRALFKKRLLTGVVTGLIGLPLVLFGFLLLLFATNLYTYQKLTHEMEVARITSQKIETGFQVGIEHSHSNNEKFILSANQWQLDARFVKFKPWTIMFGNEPLVRLERFSGRNNDANKAVKNIYEFTAGGGLLLNLSNHLVDMSGLIDTYFGSSVYMPLADGAEYLVTASVSGLVARPVNAQAENAVSAWMAQ